jgi:tetratricopeptide (TPR) repeat protein
MLASAGLKPDDKGEITLRRVLDQAVKVVEEGRLAGQGDLEAAVRQAIGSAYLSLGLYDAADQQLMTALRLQVATLGSRHPDVATTCMSLGQLAAARGKYPDAVARYRDALNIRRQAYGEEHSLYAQSLTFLADAVGKSGDASAADVLHQQAAELSRKLNSARTYEAATSLSNRAIALRGKKDWAGAEQLYRQALDIYRELYGNSNGGGHRTISRTLYNLAVVRLRQGDEAGAEALVRESMEHWRKIRPDHPELLEPSQMLQVILAARNDPEVPRLQMEILSLRADRLTRQLQALPKDTGLLRQRAHLYERLGRFQDALEDRERAIQSNADVVESRFVAGILRLYLGDAEAYRAHARYALGRFANDGTAESPEHAGKMFLLAPPDGADLTDALTCIDRALTFDHSESRIGWFELSKGLAEYRAGRFAAALQWLDKARYHCGDIVYGDPRYPEGTTLALTAMAHHRLGHAAEARESLDQAARLTNQLPKPGETDLGNGAHNWVVLQIILREARGVVGAQPAGAPPVGAPAGAGIPATRPATAG